MSALKYLYICQAKNDTSAFNVYEMTEHAVYVKDTKFIMPFISYRCNDMIVQYLTSNGVMFTQVPIQNKIPNAVSAYKYNLHGVGFDLNKLCVHLVPSLSDVLISLNIKTTKVHDELHGMIERLDTKSKVEEHELGMVSARLSQVTEMVSEIEKVNSRVETDLTDIASRIIKNENALDSKIVKTEQSISALHDTHLKKIADIEGQINDMDICLGGVVHKLDEVSIQSSNIKILGNNVADIQCSISDHDTYIENIKETISEINTKYDQVLATVKEISSDNDVLTDFVCDNMKGLRIVSNASEEMQIRIDKIQENISSLSDNEAMTSNKIDDLGGLVNMLVARMNKMELEMSLMQSIITEKDAQIQQLSSRAFINVNYMEDISSKDMPNDESGEVPNDNTSVDEIGLLGSTIDPETEDKVNTDEMETKNEEAKNDEQTILENSDINTDENLSSDPQINKSWWQIF